MQNRSKLAILLVTLSLVLIGVASAQMRDHGSWNIDRNGEHRVGSVHLNLHHSRHEQFGQDMQLSDLKGLDPSSLDKGGPVKFQLVREAGTVNFEGSITNGVGGGTYTFAANPEFVSNMKKRGFTGVEDKALALTMVDVTTAYAKELNDLGFHPDIDHVISGRIFKVNREQVDGLKSVGITELDLDKLVECRIFEVTPEFVKEMRGKNPQISLDQLVEARIFKTTPEFASEMKDAGYPNLSQEQLVAFKIHNVTPAYVREMRALGFTDLTADQLVSFRIFNVGPEQISELSKEGCKNLTADQLVAFRIHKIDAAFIDKVKKAGYSHPSPDQLVEFKIMGIKKAEADI